MGDKGLAVTAQMLTAARYVLAGEDLTTLACEVSDFRLAEVYTAMRRLEPTNIPSAFAAESSPSDEAQAR